MKQIPAAGFIAHGTEGNPEIMAGDIDGLPGRKFFSFPLLCMRYLNEHRVNTLIWSTAAFHLIANSGALEREPPQFVRTVAVGGEALMAPQLNRWRRALPVGCRRRR